MKKNLAKNIKYMRIHFGWTQRQLAEMLGLTFSSISGYEVGKVDPPVDVLQKMGALFEVNLDDLVNKDLSDSPAAPSSDALERIEARLREVEAQLSDRPEDPEQVRRLEALVDRLVKEYPDVAKKLGL